MNTTISTVAAIAVAFAGLAFMPAQKNNAMDEAVITTEKDEQSPGCDYRYKTDKSFSECERTTPPSPDESQEVEVLDKY